MHLAQIKIMVREALFSVGKINISHETPNIIELGHELVCNIN